MNDYTIQVKGVSVSYHTKRVLTNINLNIKGGNVIGVVGPPPQQFLVNKLQWEIFI